MLQKTGLSQDEEGNLGWGVFHFKSPPCFNSRSCFRLKYLIPSGYGKEFLQETKLDVGKPISPHFTEVERQERCRCSSMDSNNSRRIQDESDDLFEDIIKISAGVFKTVRTLLARIHASRTDADIVPEEL
jgi:hypothetical protein